MYAIAIALLGAMLLAWSLATTEPQDVAFRTQVAADALAANFWAYRDGLVAYQNANPGAAGKLTTPAELAALKTVQPTGYQPLDPTSPIQWSHYFENGILYTFSNIPTSSKDLPAATVDAIANRRGRSLMIGIADISGTTMTSVFNLSHPNPANPNPADPNNPPKFVFPLVTLFPNPPLLPPIIDPPVSNWPLPGSATLPAVAGIPAGALVVVGN